jgi:hypothetical protein
MTNDKWKSINEEILTMSEEQKEEWIAEGKIQWDYQFWIP